MEIKIMEKSNDEILHSKGNMVSYGFGKFVFEFLNMAFGAFVYFYYESELGLASWLTAFGYIIFAIWNAVNDPFIGYLIDRPFKFTKKWGRRFPFVFIGGVPWIISYVLLYIPPDVDATSISGMWIIFAWLVITTCLYDTFASIFNVSFYSIFPDKFRAMDERRTAAGVSTLVGTFGVALGAMLPPLFIVFGDRSSYALQSGVVLIVCLIALALAIPGAREDQVRIDCYLEACEEGEEKASFFETLKSCSKQKNFVAFIFAYIFYRSLVMMMVASLPYVARFIFEMEASSITIVMAAFLVGSFVSIPIWIKIAHKTNDNRKTYMTAAFVMTILTGILFFVQDYFVMVLMILFWGMGLGGFWVMIDPTFGDVIDESVITTEKREEGIYIGIQTFFSRMAMIVQAVSFAVVHVLTGFVEGAGPEAQPDLAIIGVRIHFALLPMIFIFIAGVILWRFFDLTPVRVKENKERLAKLGL
jgi:GPH family glycoside/pentoside/hexuronide:cation symporter